MMAKHAKGLVNLIQPERLFSLLKLPNKTQA